MILLILKPKTRSNRKNFAIRIILKLSTRVEEESFRALQKTLSKSIFLTYFDTNLTLYIDLDASKRFKFDIIIYYTSNTEKLSKKLLDFVFTKLEYLELKF